MAPSQQHGIQTNPEGDKKVYYWLLTGVAMVIIQIILGGITRLTGSGLSITEWDVVTGALPPLNEAQWLAEFDKYKGTPQYQLLNSDFGLSEFKFIFFWEWFHRLWARLIGLVFMAGFVFFIVRRYFSKDMVKPLLILFALGALQGLVGWIMVASGLEGDAVYVKPTRLALHFIFAIAVLCYTWWFALRLRYPHPEQNSTQPINRMLVFTLALLAIQLIYGALMAGHKAASAAPTWPDINGSIMAPAGLYKADHGMLNFIDNKIMVHFVHRGLAYLLLVLLVLISLRSKGNQGPTGRYWWLPMAFAGVQVSLGIFAVLTATQIVPNQWGLFEWMAQLHQAVGMLLVIALVFWLYHTRGGKKAAIQARSLS